MTNRTRQQNVTLLSEVLEGCGTRTQKRQLLAWIKADASRPTVEDIMTDFNPMSDDELNALVESIGYGV